MGASRSRFLIEHDIFGKPVSTFPDHALEPTKRCAEHRSPSRGANTHETDSSGAAGVGQGNPGATAGSSSRYHPAIDRGDAAGGGYGADAGWAEGQASHTEPVP